MRVRLFVSSTFADLGAERDALHAEVFPRLRRFCAERGVQFSAVDLRWGISREAGLDQATLRSAGPNFVLLLGERYGWRPLPQRITGRQSPDARWYRRDTNAVPASLLLQPRTGEFGVFANRYRHRLVVVHLADGRHHETGGLDAAPDVLVAHAVPGQGLTAQPAASGCGASRSRCGICARGSGWPGWSCRARSPRSRRRSTAPRGPDDVDAWPHLADDGGGSAGRAGPLQVPGTPGSRRPGVGAGARPDGTCRPRHLLVAAEVGGVRCGVRALRSTLSVVGRWVGGGQP